MENINRQHSVRTDLTRCFALFAMLVFLAGARCSFAMGDDFEAANQLFDQGKFSEARSRYDNLANTGKWSSNLFYNLGNCEYRLGSQGRAILEYERALVLDPSHPEARANLALLRNQTGAKTPAPSWPQVALAGQSTDTWAIAGAVAAWIAVFGIAALATTKRRETAGIWLLTIAGAAVCAYAGSLVWIQRQDRATAIVTAKSAEARLAPADTAELADTLPAGSSVRVLSERGNWVYCELPGAGRGWISQHTIEKVRIGKS